MSRLRRIILDADSAIIEEVKWRKPSNPGGVPVWSCEGILCVGDTLKSAVRLTFPKGAQIKDPNGLLNARLDSEKVRAVDFREGVAVDESGLRALIVGALRRNVKPSMGR